MELFLTSAIVEVVVFVIRNLTWKAVLYGAGIPIAICGIVLIVLWICERKK